MNAAGAVLRELTIPESRNKEGIQTVCWDQRVTPLPATAAAAPAGGRGGGGGGAGGPGGPGARRPIPGLPTPLPEAGYLPADPCAAEGGAGGGGFGGRGGGGGTQGPMVMPGTYTVSLAVDGKVVDSKPLTLVMDPQVQMTAAELTAYNAVLMELHTLQSQGAEVTAQVTALYSEMQKVTPKVDSSAAPAAVKSEFAAFRTEFDALRTKLGVGIPAVTFGGGGGGFGGGAQATGNVLARVGAVKGNIMGVWETPSAAVMKQVAEVKAAVPTVIADANALMTRARAVSQSLSSHGVTLTVPAARGR